MKKRLVITVQTPHQYAVTVTQTGKDSFTVEYGKQVKTGLDYATAAQEFGECVFHASACAGLIESQP